MNSPDLPAQHPTLQRQRVLIIGGGSGIGAAVAQQALARGAHVILAGRHLAALERTRETLSRYPVQLEQVDLTDASSLKELFQRVERFDHLVITAGPSVNAQVLADTEMRQAMSAFEVKFWGALRAIQLALPHLSERGSITLTSGLLSRKFVAGQLIKTTLNAALEAAAKQLAKELAPRRVNVVSPGVTQTEAYAGMEAGRREAMFERVAGSLPVGRVGQPEDIAAAFTLAMENGFITGAVLDVDGGGLL